MAWIALPGNGWGALVAACAQPSCVRGVLRSPSAVKVIVERAGVQTTWHESVSADELARQHAEITEYLALFGFAEPTAGLQWELLVPDRVTVAEVEAAVNGAQASVPNGAWALERAAVTAALAELIGT